MSCSMMTMVSLPLSCATSAASRCTPSQPRPEVGSSRNSSVGSAPSATRDLQRAAVAIGQRSLARIIGPSASPTVARISCGLLGKAGSARPAARRMSKPRARNAGSADGDVLAHGELVEQGHDLERARDALGARSRCGLRPVMSSPSSTDRAALGLVAAGQHVEAGGLAGAVRPHDAVAIRPPAPRDRCFPARRGRRSARAACGFEQRHRSPPNNEPQRGAAVLPHRMQRTALRRLL